MNRVCRYKRMLCAFLVPVLMGTCFPAYAAASAGNDNSIVLTIDDLLLKDEPERLSGYEGLSGDAVISRESKALTWSLTVPEAGKYTIAIQYYPLPGRGGSIERSLLINGKLPFDEASNMVLSRVWGNEKGFITDAAGNQIRSRQVEKPMWRNAYLTDPLGYEAQPLAFPLQAGQNTITLVGDSEDIAVASLELKPVADRLSWEQASAQYQNAGYKAAGDFYLRLQGENAPIRSSGTIFPVSDRGDPTVDPYSNEKLLLNAIGGYQWKKYGQWIEWELEVPEAGLYQLGIVAKQNEKRGGNSYRRLYVNGEVPYIEAENIAFPYTDSYQLFSITAEKGQKPLVYLKKGKNNIRLEVTLGNLGGIIQEVAETINALGAIYRQIITLTSANPDPLRQYNLDKRIPGLMDNLQKQQDTFSTIIKNLEQAANEKLSGMTELTEIRRVLGQMIQDPDNIPKLLSRFRDSTGAVGNWMVTACEQPLMIDYLEIASPNKELVKKKVSFSQLLLNDIKAFFISFANDYDTFKNTNGTTVDSTIKVWIGMGRDQGQALKMLIDDTFTPNERIRVNLEIVNNMGSMLIPSSLAGTAPDVALGAADMELAFRGALADLKKFQDFDAVSQRFNKSAFTGFSMHNAVYALPETQSFPVLFYRKDILDELGLEVPNTWDEVKKTVADLERSNMEFGLPANISTMLAFLYQKRIALYKEDGIETNLDSEEVVQTFIEMTDLFSLYSLPMVYDAANRFKLGEMPLLIAEYSLYNTLVVFAPELKGAWGFTTIPGTPEGDGVNYVAPVTVSGAVILEKSVKKQEAWTFLKWWTGAEAQYNFGMELESLMGGAARYQTANVEAMKRLPWGTQERDALLEQWKWTEGTPPIIGGYYASRQFDWLFKAVVVQRKKPRETIVLYNKRINDEIRRKRQEFDYETDLSQLPQTLKQLYWEKYAYVDRLS